jgi:tRNA (cytidine/uridine-2'-O-)-methyltransferase
MEIALIEPEIPGNTGAIGRLAVGTGSRLHLVGRLGFDVSDAAVRRAGLDYWADVDLVRHATIADFLAATRGRRLWAYSRHGRLRYDQVSYRDDDVLVFGPESVGLPEALRQRWAEALCYLPTTGKIRSLNLAGAASVVLYEALRQRGFAGIEAP